MISINRFYKSISAVLDKNPDEMLINMAKMCDFD